VGNKGLGKGDSVAKPDAISFHTIEKYSIISRAAFWTAYLKGRNPCNELFIGQR
jgi:hypothetical protein